MLAKGTAIQSHLIMSSRCTGRLPVQQRAEQTEASHTSQYQPKKAERVKDVPADAMFGKSEPVYTDLFNTACGSPWKMQQLQICLAPCSPVLGLP